MAVGRRLKLLREQHAVSMNKVHLETRMSTSYLAKLEAEEFVPGDDNLQKIIDALEILNVPDTDRKMLVKEHEAVQKQRVMLQQLEQELSGIPNPDKRLELLEQLLKEAAEKVPVLTAP